MRSIATLMMGISLAAATLAAEPGAAEIEAAMNDGIQMQHAKWQTLEGLEIEKGGETADGNFLYLCRAELVWKLGRKELVKEIQKEMDAKIERQAGKEGIGELFKGMGSIALAVVASQLGDFEAGDTVAELPVRVSLVRAGDDWIVVESVFPKGFKNPLDDVEMDGEGAGR